MEKLTFVDKLKSWKRWASIIGMLIPILLQAYTGDPTNPQWIEAGIASVVVIVAGLGVIGFEDINRVKAGVAMAEIALRRDIASGKIDYPPASREMTAAEKRASPFPVGRIPPA